MDTLMGRYRNVSILAAAVFIQLIGLAVQVKRQTENESTRLIRVWTVTAVTPLEKGLVHVQNGISSVWHNYVYLRGVRQENRTLQDKIQQLQLEQVRLTQDAQQAHRLQSLLGFKEQFIDKTTAAQVIGASGSEQSRTVYLDKGSDDGIKPDMAVISAQGVVGKVIKTFAHTSLVLLINDQNSGVGTIVERTRLQAVLTGKAGGELALDNIMAEEDLRPGDQLLTSGGDQIFPKGLPVGTIASVDPGGEFLKVKVRPAASLSRLEEVLVITQKQERTPELAESGTVRAADILANRLPTVPDKPEESKVVNKPPSTESASGGRGPVAGTATAAKPGSAAHDITERSTVNNLPVAKPALSPSAGGIRPVPAAPGVRKPGTAGQSLVAPLAHQPISAPLTRPKTGQTVAPAIAKPASVPPKPNSTQPQSSPQAESGDTPR